MSYTFALAGNQNSGKTTLFNQLTGSNQHVGNWPGVTVEQKTGTMIHHHHGKQTHLGLPSLGWWSRYRHGHDQADEAQELPKQYTDVKIVDLPGIYSLSPYSMEEIVSRNFIVKDKPDVVINCVDATNLERNLYLTLQLLELVQIPSAARRLRPVRRWPLGRRSCRWPPGRCHPVRHR